MFWFTLTESSTHAELVLVQGVEDRGAIGHAEPQDVEDDYREEGAPNGCAAGSVHRDPNGMCGRLGTMY